MTSPEDPHTAVYAHIGGGAPELLDRLAVTELCRGWPVYRDASEWKNFASIFSKDAYVWTTWSKRMTAAAFIEKSKAGKAAGDFIMHRECGTAVELGAAAAGRAVGKMKATITQRFRALVEKRGDGSVAVTMVPAAREDDNRPVAPAATVVLAAVAANNSVIAATTTTTAPVHSTPTDQQEGAETMAVVEFDIDCDCRFHFFCAREPLSEPPPSCSPSSISAAAAAAGGEWRARYVKLVYDKDKMVPVGGTADSSPALEATVRSALEQRARSLGLPRGYRLLGAAQEMLGHEVDGFLPTPHGAEGWAGMFRKMELWLAGEDVDLDSVEAKPRL